MNLEDLQFAVRVLLTYDTLAEYVEPHAENFFQNLKWKTIQRVSKQKTDALQERNISPTHKAVTINLHLDMLDFIDRAYQKHYIEFSRQLRTILDDAVDTENGVEDRIHEQKIMSLAHHFVQNFNQEVKTFNLSSVRRWRGM